MCDSHQRSLMEVNNDKSEETQGFDFQAGLTWIYPTNYPIRDYQYNIIEQALYKNTLVNLPTGLGKTFIAAVVMYNYYRWYPTGKIVFMAPTRPLVKQQIDACYNIMAIPKDVTAELTGTNKTSIRNDIWLDKRVFFVTPQVLQNDLDSCPELALLIKCIVFDEAHKARGNYAYCEVMRKIRSQAKYFRVLALSATPGNSINDVGEVINTLMISNIEYRTEESEDVKPYVFQRKLETIVVPLGQKLEQVRNDYLEILEKYTRTLLKYKVVHGNCSALTKGAIFRIKKEYQEKNNRDPHYKEVNLTLNICMSLYHANELLTRHGLRGFLNYFEEHINDPLLRNNDALIKIMEDVRSYLGPMPAIDMLPDGSYPEVPSNIMFGHPKFYRLRDILIKHFNSCDDSSKVIVFFEYRDSVKEAFLILLQARPIIRPEMFVGQKSGVVTQKMQLKVIKTFRDGACNTLLSTSIGEEGLDVGEVDLIICFDISNKSPIRMVQRMGRTGRKREGQVVILVTEGREQQTLNDCLFHKNNMKSWAGSKEIMKKFFVESPRMVPKEINPQCMKMQITVTKASTSRNGSIRNLLSKMASSSSSNISEDVEIIEIQKKIPDTLSLVDKTHSHVENFDFQPFCSAYIEHQRMFQNSSKICSSDASKLFVNLMKFADAKRFNIPLTQQTEFVSKNLRQGDIRNMFVNIGAKNSVVTSQDDFMSQAFTLPTQRKLTNEEIEYREFHNKLHEEISIYLAIQEKTTKTCGFCERGYKCSKYRIKTDTKLLDKLNNWIPPDSNFLQNITVEDLKSYMEFQSQSKVDAEDSIVEMLDSADLSDLFPDEENQTIKEKSFNFNVPESFGNLIDKYKITSSLPDEMKEKNAGEQIEKNLSKPTDVEESKNHNYEQNLSTQPCKDENLNSTEQCKDENLNSVLSFFKLDKIEDIFEVDEESENPDKTIIDVNIAQDLEFEREASPVLSTQISQRKHNITRRKPIQIERPGSPVLDSSILCRSQKDISFKGRPSLDIIDTSIEADVSTKPRNFSQKLHERKLPTNEEDNKNNKIELKRSSSTNSDEENLLGFFSTKKKVSSFKNTPKALGLEDIFDLYSFGLTIDDIENKANKIGTVEKENIGTHSNNQNEHNLTNFSMLINAESTRIEDDKKQMLTKKNEKVLKEKNMNTGQTNSIRLDGGIEPSVSEINDFCDLSIFGLTQIDEEVLSEPRKNKRLNDNSELEPHQTQFDEFSDCMGTKHTSTQENETIYKNRTNENTTKHCDKTEINDDSILIIEDSPTKDNFIDLTQSPRAKKKYPEKKKLLSQLSITQILSLAEKKTQQSLSSTQTAADNKNEQSRNEAQNTILRVFEKEPKTLKMSEDFEKKDKTHQQFTKKCDMSLLDDLRNFDEFNDSSCFKEPSPVFKKPSVSPKIMRKERKNLFSTCKPNTSRMSSNTENENKEDTNNSRASLKLNNSILNSNSDDEFETTICPSAMNKKQSSQKKSNGYSPTIPKKKVRKKKNVNHFIEEEAEVSIDGGSASDDESDDDGSFDESFVDDESQNIGDDTQMHAKYLQSVRSPSTGPKFKMPRTLRPITDDIFSQAAAREEPNSYVVDSFCVNTEDVTEESHELSELEILEEKLKMMRKKRKQKEIEGVKKRKRIRLLESDSD